MFGRRARRAKIAALLTAAPLTVLAFGTMQSTGGAPEDSWRNQLEQSWRQSPAGVLLLAKRSDQPTPMRTNLEENASPGIDIATRVQNGKFLYEMGKYDESEKLLKQVLKDAPNNRTVPYYLDLIKEARYMERYYEGGPRPMPLAHKNTTTGWVYENAPPGIDIATRVQNAKFLYEMGKYDESEKLLKQVLQGRPRQPDRSVLFGFDQGSALYGALL